MMLDTTLSDRRCSSARLFALSLGLLGAAGCSSGNDGVDPNAPIPGVAELQTTLSNEGITALAAPPTVADELFDLGKALFFDKALSGNMDVSCATCHWPELGSTDQRTLPLGVGGTGLGTARSGGSIVPRNSPSVMNVHTMDEVFWDGRVRRGSTPGSILSPAGAQLTAAMQSALDPNWNVLAAQAMFPPTSRAEMRGQAGQNTIADVADGDFTGIWQALRDRIVAFPGYQTLIAAAYPSTTLSNISFAHLANAIAAFEVRAFTLNDSPFERFVGGDDRALTAEQVRGAREFFGPGNCASCHSGNMFTDGDYHNIGLPQFGPGHGDGAGGNDDFGRENISGNPADRYAFRTPMLRNVELSAPFGRLGQYSTLLGIVDHYRNATNRLQNYLVTNHVSDPTVASAFLENRSDILTTLAGRVSNPRQFDANAIVTFLEALTDPAAEDLSSMIPATVPSGASVR